MTTLYRYYLRFFLYCIGLALLCGLLSVFLPLALKGILTIFPFLLALILVLYHFLKLEKRAPTTQETQRFAIGYVLIFWFYNLLGMLISIAFFAQEDPTLWQTVGQYVSEPKFLLTAAGMVLLLSIPMYLVTWWFYGPQAARMAKVMFKPK